MSPKASEIPALLGADDVRLLVETGFMAISQGLTDHAAAIFGAIEAARPGSEAAQLGFALVDLARNRPGPASERLRALPESDAGQAFLGMTLVRMGELERAKEVLRGLILSAPDSAAATLAADILAGLAGTEA
jgi:thioredoxin-like negative regulator of GroEL